MTCTLHEDLCTFLYGLAELFLELEVLKVKVVEKIRTHILCGITFSLENRAISEIWLKNIVELDRPLMTIKHIAFHAGQLRLQTHT